MHSDPTLDHAVDGTVRSVSEGMVVRTQPDRPRIRVIDD